MGVETVQVERPFDASLTPLTTDAEAPPGRVIGKGDVYVLSHDLNQSFTALNRLHTSGATVSWLREAIDLGDGRRYSPGAMVISGVDETVLTPLADDLRLEFVATDLPGWSLDATGCPPASWGPTSRGAATWTRGGPVGSSISTSSPTRSSEARTCGPTACTRGSM